MYSTKLLTHLRDGAVTNPTISLTMTFQNSFGKTCVERLTGLAFFRIMKLARVFGCGIAT
jgi:hypothetical protein